MLAGALTQVIELCPANLGMPLDDHFLQAGGAGEEGALDADAVRGNAADGKGGVVAACPLADDGATKFLDTLGVAFLDADMHADHVTGMQLGDIGIWSFFYGLQ